MGEKNIFGLKDLFNFAGLEERVRKTLEKLIEMVQNKQTNKKQNYNRKIKTCEGF